MRFWHFSPVLLLVAVALVLGPQSSRASEPDRDGGAPGPGSTIVSPRGRPPVDAEIVGRCFEENLGREPSGAEQRKYLERAAQSHWTQEDLEGELRSSREFRELTPEAIIRRAYRDLLEREPDAQSMRIYRRHLVDDGWRAGQVRQAIRDSDEYQIRRVDRIIERAYDDLLERAPDREGRERYRKFLREGGTEAVLRDRLKESVEYRVTLPDSKTTKAYRAVLGRDPDPHGLENYRKKLVDHGWTQKDIEAELRRSSEYQDRLRKKS